MSVGEDFQKFCNSLAISTSERSTISSRYKAITKRLNTDFWDFDSETAFSFYSGSYGRGTAINGISDLDMLFQLPSKLLTQYSNYKGNGPSALLQLVRNSILKTYSTTSVGADGQVVVVSFSDGTVYEVVPAFEKTDGSFIFPDANNNGSWRVCNPKPEIKAISDRDSSCNGNLKLLCKMMRTWKKQWNVPMSGMLIDTLAYNFIGSWKYRDKSYLYFDWLSRDFFYYMKEQKSDQTFWFAPGSNQKVWRKGLFEYKAKQSYNLALAAIEYADKKMEYSSRQKWREIYGTTYPS